MWMRAEGKVAFASATPPQWVNDWLSRRRGPSQAAQAADAAPKASIAAASSGEGAAVADPKAEARAAAQRERNRRDREAAILAGLDEFDLWLSDQLETGMMRTAR